MAAATKWYDDEQEPNVDGVVIDFQKKPRVTMASLYCLPLAEFPCRTHKRWVAQQVRRDLIDEGLADHDTYVSRVVLPNGEAVWRVAMPLI